jgi:hypothetical protein
MSEFDETNHEEKGLNWYDEKSARMDEMLGKSHDTVMHSLFPYGLGGALDLYYYPNGIPGTGIATKELSELPGEGSSNDWYQNYEFVMFTKEPLDLEQANNENHPFGKIHRRMNGILNCMARYSAEATLNPGETCEFPEEMEELGGGCLIFDAYQDREDETDFGLLVLIEVYREEMELARTHGSQVLLDLLKSKGHYPYSDLDRAPVVDNVP